tara:strand:- start:2927 stop:3058 length:132 start_codon:yes stop_codon:yes gene_type:complete
MFLLVYWRIPIKKEITDEIANDSAVETQNIEETNMLIKKEIKF